MKQLFTSVCLFIICGINIFSNLPANNVIDHNHTKVSPDNNLTTLINKGRILLDRGVTDSVRLLLDRTYEIYNGVIEANSRYYFDYYLLKGQLLNLTGYYTEAVKLFDRLYDEITSKDSVNYYLLIKIFNELGYANGKKGSFNKALNYYLRSLETCRKYYGNNKELIYILGNIVDLYTFKDKYYEAKEYFNRCVFLIDSLKYPEDKSLFNSYIACTLYYSMSYKSDKALKYLNIAENILSSNYNPTHYKYCIIYYYNGRILLNLQKLDKALIFFEKSLKMAKMSDILNDYVFLNYRKLGELYYYKKDYNSSVEYKLRCLKEIKNTGISPVYTYISLGDSYSLLKDYKNVLYYFNLAESWIMHESGINHLGLFYIYIQKSLLYRDTQEHDKEAEYLELSYNSAIENGIYRSREVTFILRYLGRYYYRQGEYKRSLDTLQKALISATNTFNNTNIYKNPDIEDARDRIQLLYTLKRKAYAMRKYYERVTNNLKDIEASFECYKLATRLQEKIITTFSNENTKLRLSASQKINLNNTLEIALEIYKLTNDYKYLEEAFNCSEKGKSLVLLTYINEEKAKQFADIPDSLISLEQDIKNEIASLTFQINSIKTEYTSQNQLDAIKSRLLELTRKEEELVSLFEIQFPKYYNLKYNFNAVPIRLIESSIEGNQALIEYALTNKKLYTFLVTIDTVIVHMQDIDNSFSENIVKFRTLLSENRYGNYDIQDYNDFVKISFDLYNILIKPVTGQIKNKSLIIVSDEVINLIPFEVLITKNTLKSGIADFGELPYLLKEYPVSYAYSASLLMNQKEYKHNGSKLIAFVPDYGQSRYAGEHNYDSVTNDPYKLSPLIGTKEEVNFISKFYRSKIYFNEQALEENFKKYAGRFSIIHLAMHTIIDDKNPMFSKMVFTPKQDKTEDGLLHTFELYSIKLQSDLVVLSGCNTGYGKMQRGEGLLSLARGFVFSGCSGLLLTQWAVADKASVKLMENFYYYLSKGYPKEKALHYAKIDYLKDADPVKTHPYYWASYIIFGDTCPLPPKSSDSKYYLIAVLLLLITIVYYLKRNKIRNLRKYY
jgi:CHAT domain-containing protein/tetratricopeptide (TPR) repeat protein